MRNIFQTRMAIAIPMLVLASGLAGCDDSPTGPSNREGGFETGGPLLVTVSTFGSNLPSEGHTVEVTWADQTSSLRLAPLQGTVSFSGLAPGPATATLIYLESNCEVLSLNPQTTDVNGFVGDGIRFEVACS